MRIRSFLKVLKTQPLQLQRRKTQERIERERERERGIQRAQEQRGRRKNLSSGTWIGPNVSRSSLRPEEMQREKLEDRSREMAPHEGRSRRRAAAIVIAIASLPLASAHTDTRETTEAHSPKLEQYRLLPSETH
jgi:hypothetical protein